MAICNYQKKIVCDLYDNQSDISGQATNVFINSERNGWKELTFDIPSTCNGENGIEENYRLKYLIAEYRIKVVEDGVVDWYVISEPKITRNNFSKNVSVTAGHISQLLKHKSLDLEFSDEEGNNVGTAEELLNAILEGTGWQAGYVATFLEDDGSVKKRTISGQAGTGALALIESLCDVFEAKPVYHGDKTIDILPMNPFAKIQPEAIPAQLKSDNAKILELYYSRNIHDLVKTANTDNMATRLYAYGSYGDLNGICTLQTAEHLLYTFEIENLANEYCFTVDGVNYFFSGDVNLGDTITWSTLDLTSMSYVYNETQSCAYEVYKKPTTQYETLTGSAETVVNEFPYLLGLQYYRDVGLMTDEQFQQIAEFQHDLPTYYENARTASEQFIEGEAELSKLAEDSNGMLKLKISSVENEEETDVPSAKWPYKFIIDTEEGTNGVLYRTDYDKAERRYFKWHVTDKLKANGFPVKGTPSVILVIHDTNPVTYDMSYLKRIYDSSGNLVEDEDGKPKDFEYSYGDYPSAITVFDHDLHYNSGDNVYLFCTDTISGYLGAMLTTLNTIGDTIPEVTQKHNVMFVDADRGETPGNVTTTEYEWRYDYHTNSVTRGDLYFAWVDKFSDDSWKKVYLSRPESFQNGEYFYSFKTKKLYRASSGSWVEIEERRSVVDMFESVLALCLSRDRALQGLYENYTRTGALPVGNYAFYDKYTSYYRFKLKDPCLTNIRFNLNNKYIYPDNTELDIVTTDCTDILYVMYPVENQISQSDLAPGDIDTQTGVVISSETAYMTKISVPVFANTTYEYNLAQGSKIYYYDKYYHYINYVTISSATGNITTPENARYIKYVQTGSQFSGYFRVKDYDKNFIFNEEVYTILDDFVGSGEIMGVTNLMGRFQQTADTTFINYLTALQQAQQAIKDKENLLTASLDDMLKDGRWQDSNYVYGDEKRLYDDTLYMLRQVSYPEISYTFNYLDMFGVKNIEMKKEDMSWPDIDITYMAHLVDTESNTNCWAYMDKIEKCYNKPWETQIEIDTKLTLASRHSFTDVLSRIAEVAKEMNSKKSIYDTAVTEPVNGSRLEGTISLNQVLLDGGVSNFYNDEKGNLIFETVDGSSAMMLSGNGLGIATGKTPDGVWAWRTAATGQGITADAITTGTLSADRIDAGSITTDKIASNFGEELDLSSNVALNLFATVDGTKPSGRVSTTDAKIEIKAGDNTQNPPIPAKINITSGGELNLSGGNISIESDSEINIDAGETLSLTSDGGDIKIGSGTSVFTVGADSYTTTENATYDRAFIYNGKTSIEDISHNGIYLGTDGINIGTSTGKYFTAKPNGDLEVTGTIKASSLYILNNNQYKQANLSLDDNGNILLSSVDFDSLGQSGSGVYITPSNVNIGSSGAVNISGGDVNISGSDINITASSDINIATNESLQIGNSNSPFVIGADQYPINGSISYYRSYIYNGRENIEDTTNKGVYIGTDGINIGDNLGNRFVATADGNINISGGNFLCESADHLKAMRLSSTGLEIASRQTEQDAWQWSTFGDGAGFNYDSLISGTIDHTKINVNSLDLTVNEDLVAYIGGKAEEAAAGVKLDDEGFVAFFNDNVKDDIDSEIQSVQTDLNGYKAYMRFDDSGTLELGKNDSSMVAQLTNDRLSFVNNGTEVSYISGDSMYITNARVTETLSVGTEDNGYFDWVVTPTGLGLKWRVVEQPEGEEEENGN